MSFVALRGECVCMALEHCPYLNLRMSVNVGCTCAKSSWGCNDLQSMLLPFQKCLQNMRLVTMAVCPCMVNSSRPHPTPALCGWFPDLE